MNTEPDVVIREVSLRDGLQSLPQVVPTSIKLQWLQAAYAAGLREIEVSSFVPPRLMPQLADAAEVLAAARALPGLKASVLVPNLKGALRAMECEAHAMLLPLSASHAHSLANLRKTPDDVLREIENIVAARDAAGSRCAVEVGLSTAFGCTLQGEVPEDEVLRLVRAVRDAGVDAIGLADTVGHADPAQVQRLFTRALEVAGDKLSCAHFHDTRGLGSANVYAAWLAGIRRFDACLGGIGGCPHAPGASGNVATEDVAYLMARMDQRTGVDLSALLALRGQLSQWLEGAPLHGSIWRAGPPKTLAPAAQATHA